VEGRLGDPGHRGRFHARAEPGHQRRSRDGPAQGQRRRTGGEPGEVPAVRAQGRRRRPLSRGRRGAGAPSRGHREPAGAAQTG
jgi:hypothetical protein